MDFLFELGRKRPERGSVELVERSSKTVGPIRTQRAEDKSLGCTAAAIGSGGGRVLQGAGFQEFENDQTVMKIEALGYGFQASQVERLRCACVVEVPAEPLGELRGERLAFRKFTADGEGVADNNAEGIASRQRWRIVEAISIGGELDSVIAAKGWQVSDAGDTAIRIVAVVVFIGDERAHGIRIVAEHRLPSAKREWVERNEAQ